MRMSMNADYIAVEREHMVDALQHAVENLDSDDRELVLDFSRVDRIDCGTISAMEELAGAADQKRIKIVFRNVDVKVYKALKLTGLERRFWFENDVDG